MIMFNNNNVEISQKCTSDWLAVLNNPCKYMDFRKRGYVWGQFKYLSSRHFGLRAHPRFPFLDRSFAVRSVPDSKLCWENIFGCYCRPTLENVLPAKDVSSFCKVAGNSWPSPETGRRPAKTGQDRTVAPIWIAVPWSRLGVCSSHACETTTTATLTLCEATIRLVQLRLACKSINHIYI